MTQILAIDVGNTRAKFGVFETGQAALPQAKEIRAAQLATTGDLSQTVGEWLNQRDFEEFNHCVLAGSNPPACASLVESWPLANKPRIISGFQDIPIRIDVDEPSGVGIDRLLTAFAVRHLISSTQPAIVIDAGTATTVNLVTSDGTFRGGAIMPGLRLSARAMHDYTARLPLIDADRLSDDSDSIDAPLPGRNTSDAMKSGLFWGQLGAIRELSQGLAVAAMTQFNESLPPVHVLTGGGGRQLVSQLPNAVYVDSLALHGLAILVDTLPGNPEDN